MQLWPEPSKRKRLVWSMLALALAAGFAGYRLRHTFGLGKADLTPHVAGEVPSDTPLPRGKGEGGPSPMRTSWRSVPAADRSGLRRYLLLTPEAWAGEHRGYPLVVVIHGDGGSAESFHRAFPFEAASLDHAQLAYPEGLHNTWDTESREPNRDVLFLDTILDHAIAEGADPNRLYLTGYSSGGFLAQLYACQRSQRVRAIVTHEAGAPYNQAERWPDGATKCPGQRSVPLLATHGRNDFSVGFKSGVYSAHYWAGVNGCDIARAAPTGYSECYAYAECQADKPVVFCDIAGLGHWIWDRGAEASMSFFGRLEQR